MGMKTVQSIEDLAINTLQKGSRSPKELVESISLIRANGTKQGVYRVLRKLKKEEKIVIHGRLVSLNLQWIKKMSEFYSLAEHYYSFRAGADSFLNLSDREKIIYFFKNLRLLDAFASHVLHMLNEIVDSKESTFVYNPHEWFFYAREEAEKMLVDAFTESKRQVLITSTHSDPLDQGLKQYYNNDLLQYNISSKTIGKDNYYFLILGGYLIEVFIDEKMAREIDLFYKDTKMFDEEASKRLHELITRPSHNKLVISRNKNKIEKYKKALAKSFYISRDSSR